MLVALGLSVVLLAAVVGALLYLSVFVPDGWSIAVIIGMIVGSGYLAQAAARRSGRRRRPVPDGERRRLRHAVQRVSVQADVPPPECELVRDSVPLSWTFAPLGGAPTIHATTGLLARLDDRELQAVVAHELGHVVHRDAIVMTMLGGPPAAFFSGVRHVFEEDFRGWIAAPTMLVFFGGPALVMLLLSRIVSRHRELAADRAAALLTGSPASVAAALAAVDDDLSRLRARDLRRVRAREAARGPRRRPPARRRRRRASP